MNKRAEFLFKNFPFMKNNYMTSTIDKGFWESWLIEETFRKVLIHIIKIHIDFRVRYLSMKTVKIRKCTWFRMVIELCTKQYLIKIHLEKQRRCLLRYQRFRTVKYLEMSSWVIEKSLNTESKLNHKMSNWFQ